MCRLSPPLREGIGVLRENSKRNSFFIGEKRKEITKEMLKIYVPYSGLDWMNYRIVRRDMTFHHILKREDGGGYYIENGALLMPVAHQYLHLIEFRDEERYKALNKIFEIVNHQEREPTREQREIVEYLLKEFERMHQRDKNSKGKILIRREYKIRGDIE